MWGIIKSLWIFLENMMHMRRNYKRKGTGICKEGCSLKKFKTVLFLFMTFMLEEEPLSNGLFGVLTKAFCCNEFLMLWLFSLPTILLWIGPLWLLAVLQYMVVRCLYLCFITHFIVDKFFYGTHRGFMMSFCVIFAFFWYHYFGTKYEEKSWLESFNLHCISIKLHQFWIGYVLFKSF